MHFIIYRITNIITGTFYIGVHKTKNINDTYLGSGTLIRKAIREYGKENFTKEILEELQSEEEMLKREEEIVTKEFIQNNDVYNIMVGGGYGSREKNGLTFINKKHSKESRKKIQEKRKGKKLSEQVKLKMSKNHFSKKDQEAHREIAKKASRSRKNIKDGLSAETKEKIRNAILIKTRKADYISHNKGLKREKIKCPFCNKEGSMNTMKRWHFNNCKIVP
jgi:group I intron endonuclease